MNEQTERERIINLIEQTYQHNEEPFCYKCDLINLINEEN